MPRLWTIGLAVAAILAVPAMARDDGSASVTPPVPPDLIELAPGAFSYRASGAFTRDGKPETAPMVAATIRRPLAMMRHQVTVAEYRRCVSAGACPMVAQDGPDRPVVKVSWQDAQAYASWLSRATGSAFRLPSDEEWAYAAAERVVDDALPDRAEGGDPGRRALARYDLEADGDRVIDQAPQPVGRFGANANGLLDMAGNVWEWTDTCFTRSALDGRDASGRTVDCWVRVVEGRHRTYLSNFVRTARGGGCSAGIPVSNLGFRLVRDDESWNGPRSIIGWTLHLVGIDA